MTPSRRGAALLVALVLAGCVVALAPALAQAPPSAFGGARPPAPGGLVGWIIEQQALFYRQLSAAVRGIRSGQSGAAWTLVGLSFLYGVFHAAGPGHGKAVISSYIVANGATIRRGVALAALSSLVQALTAIALVGFLAALLGVTARTMTRVVNWVEIAAYGLIIAIGLRLTWQKGRAFLARFASWRENRPVPGMACDDACVHLPAAEQVARIHSWREALAVVLSVGLRPCTGAVLILVFALSQGIVQAGVAATFAMAVGTAITVAVIAALASGAKGLAVRLASARTGAATLVLSAAELVAAAIVVLFGVGLLTGYLVVERMMPF
ncbi:nickel/cobalt transporter [Phreatobacter cathodiphilus]|uniref:Nickel/cobalt efflux system n=1 Tax=Phreatobacter cathodiphilus TaxID=1868589 RepID=A0A2S0ND90_9HYPH|nr:nickel/cobalt transporter [Phreatobacter cathodiphilus]AVO46115.1 nickel transporter [Phreatobacter cathodiphilus]